MAARIARRIERQDQNRDGEEYAAYWNHSKNRQHGLCITESACFPNTNAKSFSPLAAIATHPRRGGAPHGGTGRDTGQRG
jgi:hypothetical protein